MRRGTVNEVERKKDRDDAVYSRRTRVIKGKQRTCMSRVTVAIEGDKGREGKGREVGTEGRGRQGRRRRQRGSGTRAGKSCCFTPCAGRKKVVSEPSLIRLSSGASPSTNSSRVIMVPRWFEVDEGQKESPVDHVDWGRNEGAMSQRNDKPFLPYHVVNRYQCFWRISKM